MPLRCFSQKYLKNINRIKKASKSINAYFLKYINEFNLFDLFPQWVY